jgi:hypothetical protein
MATRKSTRVASRAELSTNLDLGELRHRLLQAGALIGTAVSVLSPGAETDDVTWGAVTTLRYGMSTLSSVANDLERVV